MIAAWTATKDDGRVNPARSHKIQKLGLCRRFQATATVDRRERARRNAIKGRFHVHGVRRRL